MADTLRMARRDLAKLKKKVGALRKVGAPRSLLGAIETKLAYLEQMIESLKTLEKLRQHLSKEI